MLIRMIYIIYQRIYTFFRIRKNKYSSRVLMFHNISNDDNDITISKENFIKMINILYRKFSICKIEDIETNRNSKCVVITFDDVFCSVYENAYPLLRELQIPYYLFLNISMLDTTNYISTNQVKEMLSNSNCILGSHSLEHVFMRNLTDDEVYLDMLNSRKYIEKEFNSKCTSYAFPYGSIYACSKKNINQASKLYDFVFTTINMNFDGNFNNIPRININNKCKFLKEINK